jgi:hypothetical protein
MSTFDTPSYELKTSTKYLPEETAKDPNFIDNFLDLVLLIVTNYRSTSRGNISELLKILDADPHDGFYTYKISQVSKATRILYSIMKNNFEEYNAVERTIKRLNTEIKIIKDSKTPTGTQLDKWTYIQCPNEVVHKSSRQELIRVLFRLLNSSIFKNDPNQGNFNPNFVSNSRKILDSGLFDTCVELFRENIEENADTHDVVFISAMHLIALVMNDLPAQISKACDTFLPDIFKSLEKRMPNYNSFYLSALKLTTAVTVHERGKDCLKNCKLLEKIIQVPIEADYSYNFLSCERTFDYNTYLRDLLKNDDEFLKRTSQQLFRNVDLLIEELVKYTKEYFTYSVKDREDLYDYKKPLSHTRAQLTDQVDTFFNLVSYIITDVNGGLHNRIVEQTICTPEFFEKIMEFFEIPLVGDILAKDNAIIKDVFKTFIHEHPKLFECIHDRLKKALNSIEEFLGPLKEAVDYNPKSSTIFIEQQLSEITPQNVASLYHPYNNNERLMHTYLLVRNYSCLIRGGARKIHTFLELDISDTIIRLALLRKAIITGGSKVYMQRLANEYEVHDEAVQAFDVKAKKEKEEAALNSQSLTQSQKINLEEVIGTLTRAEYEKKYVILDDFNYNYNRTDFSGILEIEDSKRTYLEKEAENCQTELLKLIQL